MMHIIQSSLGGEIYFIHCKICRNIPLFSLFSSISFKFFTTFFLLIFGFYPIGLFSLFLAWFITYFFFFLLFYNFYWMDFVGIKISKCFFLLNTFLVSITGVSIISFNAILLPRLFWSKQNYFNYYHCNVYYQLTIEFI